MSLTEHIHDEYVHNRRMRVLSDHLAKIIPQDFHMLDVGCGGGLLARLITQKRSDLDVRGIDVLVRDRIHISIDEFDGQVIPFMDRVGDARWDVALPYNYWPRQRWFRAFDMLRLKVGLWTTQLGIYSWPASLVFDRSLHFAARLDLP